MKNCTECKHADWQRNAAGNLHPSGQGSCGYGYKVREVFEGWAANPANEEPHLTIRAAIDAARTATKGQP